MGPHFKDVEKILEGELKNEINNLFLTQNNNVDTVFIKDVFRKWTPNDSVSTNSFSLLFAFSLLGTQDLSILKDEKIFSDCSFIWHS